MPLYSVSRLPLFDVLYFMHRDPSYHLSELHIRPHGRRHSMVGLILMRQIRRRHHRDDEQMMPTLWNADNLDVNIMF